MQELALLTSLPFELWPMLSINAWILMVNFVVAVLTSTTLKTYYWLFMLLYLQHPIKLSAIDSKFLMK
ncbi:hypothetical protein JCM19239_7723 [Vibrio variabilis]|uniref:Uncharacterized protein n=1 Tax=Vibrio variabilis TaxID=990271 RepID=A0ABQ0J4S7_9VIBR|nr:hypothetical protein JCM19239_7723 [Vibrio variabilis]